MTSTKLRVGILGAARINRRFVPAVRASADAEIVAIASRNEEKAAAQAAQWSIPTVYGSYEALLADPAIDIVYLPLPNALHAEWAQKALQAGKHVLCEKPLALQEDDAAAIAKTAQASQRLAMEGFMYRFHPQHQKLMSLLAEGEIGEPQLLRGTFAFCLAEGANIRLQPTLGGGATWDVGCYGVNIARWVFGREPEKIVATGSMVNGVDERVAAILDFGSDQRAVLDYGIRYGRRAYYEVIGTRGSLSIENMWQEPDMPAYVYIRNEKGLHVEIFPPENHFVLQLDAFCRAVREGASAPYSLEDSAKNIRVCREIVASLRSQ